jgi:putative FmdB family regulatory protein
MPLFNYICEKCDHDFEELVTGKDDVVACPKCNSKKLERQTSMPGMPLVKASASGCGDLSLPPCGATGCRRTGKR